MNFVFFKSQKYDLTCTLLLPLYQVQFKGAQCWHLHTKTTESPT